MLSSDINYFSEKIDELLTEMTESGSESELYLVIEMIHNAREELFSISAEDEDSE